MRLFTNGLIAGMIFLFAGCSSNNVDVDNTLKKHFDDNKVTGSFGMFDNALGKFTIYNLSQYRDSAYLPGSTFTIVNALISIQTGVVKDDSTVIQRNGKPSSNSACNADLPMYQAFRFSCASWFQELARRTGRDTLQKWTDSIGYARRYGRAVINKIDTFWQDNSIKVTPDEQLGLVKRLYFLQLPFQPRTQRTVKSMMLMENDPRYKLSYNTGAGNRENGNPIGWITGWIEENKHPYFFILQIESADAKADISAIRMKMLKDILHQYGFMEGRK